MPGNDHIHIRWMIRRDMDDVMSIENQSFEFPWHEEDFLRCLRQRNCIGMVAETADNVTGFMVYELEKDQLRIINFAVYPEFRRSGVGRTMAEKLINKLCDKGRQQIKLEIRDSNFKGQMFFKAMGFQAVEVLRNHYEETDDDAYVMQYSFEPNKPVETGNRITQQTNGE